MSGYPTKNILKVFLAPPGDVEVERRIAREIIADLNSELGMVIPWHIELLGWENTLPGYGRAQSRINSGVDECSLFIGLLWMRWGSPTGKYSSGFEEEFERARVRRIETGLPEMWTFFKRIDKHHKADPGEQLKQVLNFREKLVASKELYYREFANQKEWRKILRQCLIRHVASLAFTPEQGKVALVADTAVPRVGTVVPLKEVNGETPLIQF